MAVYTDYAYHSVEGRIHAERAFALFLARLAPLVGRFVVVGRLDPDPASRRARYALGDAVEFIALPYYPSLANPLRAGWAMLRSLPRLWRALDDVDAVWLLGPHALAIAFAGIAIVRRRRIVLGVRQDLPAYVRNRRPRRPELRAAAQVLELTYRAMARLFGVVVVGPDLARRYSHARRLCEISVSLVEAGALVAPEAATARDYSGALTMLSVGRLDREKNPVMLADVLALVAHDEPGWRLAVCGEGTEAEALAARLDALGVADRAELRGYVPHDRLREAYEGSHAVVLTSWTEGLPQVLVEAFAAGTPVVATDVGGIRDAVGEAVALVPPGDAEAAAAELRRLASDSAHRARLVAAGNAYVSAHTIDAECGRVAAFLAA